MLLSNINRTTELFLPRFRGTKKKIPKSGRSLHQNRRLSCCAAYSLTEKRKFVLVLLLCLNTEVILQTLPMECLIQKFHRLKMLKYPPSVKIPLTSTSVSSSVFLPWSLVRIENGPIFGQRRSTLFPLSDCHMSKTERKDISTLFIKKCFYIIK